MDEKALRAHFERVAGASVPASTVDVARARRAGRRRLRFRRAGVPAASFGVVIAVGALFASGVLPTGAASRTTAATGAHKQQQASGPMAPASFDPLTIYATFGWLPPGFSLIDNADPQTALESYTTVTGPNSLAIELRVYAAHQCSITGPIVSPPEGTFSFTDGGKGTVYLRSRHYPHGLQCNAGVATGPLVPIIAAGELAGGQPAYVLLDDYGHPTALAWQYARDGWAWAQSLGPTWPAQIREIAAHVHFGAKLRVPFPFKLTGVPASWTLFGAAYQVDGGNLRGSELVVGPSQDPSGTSIEVVPSWPHDCSKIGGTTQPATFDGAAGTTRNAGTEACFANLHGWSVDVVTDQPVGALGMLRHVQFLGLDPANWTTHPLG